jgi:hypothetical protein
MKTEQNVMERDITSKIERLEALEERWGVSLEALSSSIEGPDDDGKCKFKLSGQVRSITGLTIDKDLRLVVTLHDGIGRVVNMGEQTQSTDRFWGRDPFEFRFIIHESPCKIKVYPKKPWGS